jgi:bifunctional DNA-binding transcriptional regulator/antitoxin component of YhaV-PrlF toxin-antitoxin module
MDKSWTLEVKEDPENGDSILEFPDDLMEAAGWKEGDTLEWIDNKDGTWTMKKREPTQWVMVEAVTTFRHRYMVEVPVGVDQYGKDKSEWALDTVTMQEAKEFSQEYIGEQIISHRTLSKDEALKICDRDNDYASSWDEETKMKNFFTAWKEQQK